MNPPTLKDLIWILRFQDYPFVFQFAGVIFLLSYLWIGANLKKRVNFFIQSQSTGDPLNTRVQFTGPKGDISSLLPEEGAFSKQLFYGRHSLEVISPTYELIESLKSINITRHTNEIILFLSPIAFKDKNDESTSQVKITAPQITQHETGEVVLLTEIKSLSSTENRALRELSIGNFHIEERYRGYQRQAEITSVKPISSAFRVIVATDLSGSMRDNFSQVRGAVLSLADTLANSRSGLSFDSRIAILKISGDQADISDFIHSSKRDIWFSLDLHGRSDLASSLLALPQPKSENTPIWDSIHLALDQLDRTPETAYRIILLLSDGKRTRGNRFEKIKDRVNLSSVPVFAIGYRGEQGIDRNALTTLANISLAGEQGSGSFFIDESTEVADIFEKIAIGLSGAYEITWRPTGAGIGELVQVKIQVSYEGHRSKFEDVVFRTYLSKTQSQKI